MSAANGNVLRHLLAAWVVVVLLTQGSAGSGGGTGHCPPVSETLPRALIVVGVNGSGDYSSIQEAIDSASDGDTIHVWNGTYYENLQIHKTLTIMGNGSEHTIVDGGGKGNVINITVDWVNITGLCIRNSSNAFDTVVGAGIHSKWGDNITFSDNRIHDNRFGIYLRRSTDTRIGNNIIETNYGGNIYLEECYEPMIDNNTIQNSHGDGIRIMYSPRVQICDNFVDDHSDSGLYLTGSDHPVVRGNTFNDSRDSGIVFETLADHARIEGNICNNNTPRGMSVAFCHNSTIMNNNISDNDRVGIFIMNSDDCIISGNIISGNDEEGLMLRYKCSRNVVEDNVIYSNARGIYLRSECFNNIMRRNNCHSNLNSGIRTYLGCSSNSVTENTLSDSQYGLSIQSSENIVEGNICVDNSYVGLVVAVGSRNLVVNNTCIRNGEGIKVINRCSNTLVYNNTCVDNENGIAVWSDCERNEVMGNDISGSLDTGIWVSSNSNLNNISHNQVGSSGMHGIYVRRSDENTVTNNTVISNEIGIHLNESVDNEIYHNDFIDNTVQAMGNMSNRFDNGGGEGNFWSDYGGLDNGEGGRISGDGVGDTEIPHLGFDDYPFLNRSGWKVEGLLGIPRLAAPAGISYTGNFTLNWTGSLRAIGYSLEESAGPDFNESIEVFQGSHRHFTLADRNEGTYYYRVRAFNDDAQGNWSIVVSVKVVGAVEVTMDEDAVALLSAPLLFWNLSMDSAVFSCTNPHIAVDYNGSVQQFILRPMADWCGSENLTLHGDDGNMSWGLLLRVSVSSVNDPPGPVFIEHPEEGGTNTEGETIYFRASCKDPDIPYGEKLTYSWFANTTGHLGDGQSLSGTILPYGAHMVRVVVTDLEGANATDLVNITVTGNPGLDSDGDGMPNEWERRYGLDPYDPSDADGDMDGDGATNLQEYHEDTDPTVDESPDGDGGEVDGEDGGEDGGDGTVDGDEGPDGDGVSDGDDDAEGAAEKEDSGVEGGNLGTILAVLVVLVILGLFINEILLTRKWNREREIHRREGAPAEHEMAPYDPQPQEARGPADDFEDGSSDITSFMVEGAEEMQALPSGDGVDVQGPEAAVTEETPVEGSVIDPQNPASR